MSKGNSGLFKGTVGEKSENNIGINELINIIKERTKDLDLREHPIKNKELSKKKMKEIKEKIDHCTATKKEYYIYNWNKRFKNRKDKAVEDFWKQERRRLKQGLSGTRNWNNEQKEAILGKKRPKYKGKTLQGHHSYSASLYPHLANKHEVIVPLSYIEHFKGWHGGNFKNSHPGKPIKFIIEF